MLDIAATPASRERALSFSRARLAEALMRVSEDDQGAFHELYVLTSAKLFGICLRVCGERQAAEDVLHEAYLTIWKRAGAWDPARGAAITWLATIARNRAIDWRRANNRNLATIPIDNAFFLADPSADAETALLAVESGTHVRACLESLDPRHRDPIRAAFFDGATYAELAELHGVPLSTMKSRVRRGLAKMGSEFQRIESASSSSGHEVPRSIAAA